MTDKGMQAQWLFGLSGLCGLLDLYQSFHRGEINCTYVSVCDYQVLLLSPLHISQCLICK